MDCTQPAGERVDPASRDPRDRSPEQSPPETASSLEAAYPAPGTSAAAADAAATVADEEPAPPHRYEPL